MGRVKLVIEWLIDFFSNGALWVVLTGIGFFWLSVWLLGTAFTRDAVDILATIVGSALAAALLPHAYRRWRAGGAQGNWKLLMSNALFWCGVVAAAYWAYAVRAYGRPDWMVASPLNGFWRYWIVGAGILTLAALRDEAYKERGVPQSRIYYVGLGFAAGAILMATVGRLFFGPWFPSVIPWLAH